MESPVNEATRSSHSGPSFHKPREEVQTHARLDRDSKVRNDIAEQLPAVVSDPYPVIQ